MITARVGLWANSDSIGFSNCGCCFGFRGFLVGFGDSNGLSNLWADLCRDCIGICNSHGTSGYGDGDLRWFGGRNTSESGLKSLSTLDLLRILIIIVAFVRMSVVIIWVRFIGLMGSDCRSHRLGIRLGPRNCVNGSNVRSNVYFLSAAFILGDSVYDRGVVSDGLVFLGDKVGNRRRGYRYRN